ncbi:MAG: DoxX family protein [Acidobacteriota bacterium]
MLGPGLLLLRFVLATILVMHGSHILFGTFAQEGAGPGGLTQTAAYFGSLGLTPAMAFAVTAGVLRLAGGLLIAIGYFTRLMAGALLVLECLQIWKDSGRWGFFLNSINDPTRGNGMEYAVLFVGVLACLLLGGAGDWSIDGSRANSAASRAAARARVRDRS